MKCLENKDVWLLYVKKRKRKREGRGRGDQPLGPISSPSCIYFFYRFSPNQLKYVSFRFAMVFPVKPTFSRMKLGFLKCFVLIPIKHYILNNLGFN